MKQGYLEVIFRTVTEYITIDNIIRVAIAAIISALALWLCKGLLSYIKLFLKWILRLSTKQWSKFWSFVQHHLRLLFYRMQITWWKKPRVGSRGFPDHAKNPVLLDYATMGKGGKIIYIVISDEGLHLLDPIYGNYITHIPGVSREAGFIYAAMREKGYALVFPLGWEEAKINDEFYSVARHPSIYEEFMPTPGFDMFFSFRLLGQGNQVLDVATAGDTLYILDPVYRDWTARHLLKNIGYDGTEESIKAWLTAQGCRIIYPYL